MTTREAVRTAILVGGIWLVISAFASVTSMFVGFGELATRVDRSAADVFGDFFVFYLPSGLAGIAVGVLPGIYAILSSHKWAARIVPTDHSTIEIQPSLILAVGAMLLGLSTGISGAVSLASAGLILALQFAGGSIADYAATMVIRSVAYGLCSLIAGVLVFRWGSRGVLLSGRGGRGDN